MTKIEWTDVTWNPIRARHRASGNMGHYCVKVSPGCKNCYAERMQPRFGNHIRYAVQDRDQVEIFLDEKTITAPLRWKKPRMVFVCSMTDIFGAWVSDEWLDRMFAVMALTPQHTYQVLTKRPERMRKYICAADELYHRHDSGVFHDRFQKASGWQFINQIDKISWPLPNIWLGTSVENQATTNERIPLLLHTPAVKRFVSCEPLLGQVDITKPFSSGEPPVWWINPLTGIGDPGALAEVGVEPIIGPKIDWVICGGESGPGARPMHPDWARALRDQCKAADVPFFMKQMTKKAPIPDDLMVMEWPA